MLPGSRYIATDSSFWREPTAPREMTEALVDSCAAFVVYASGPGDWQPALDSGGYVWVPDAPLPTYRATRSAVGCTSIVHGLGISAMAARGGAG